MAEPAVVITAVFGGRDVPREPTPQDAEAVWLCYTDDPALPCPPPWRVVRVRPRHSHPALASKWVKMRPPTRHRDVVWLDANMEVMSPEFVSGALASRNDGVAIYAHPRRDCIFEECEASLTYEGQNGRYADQPLQAQVDHYRAEGHPEHGGLYASGVVAWDMRSALATRLGRVWLLECLTWSFQDQLSFPVVARRLGVEPGVFPHKQIVRYRPWMQNPWLVIHPHGSALEGREPRSGDAAGGSRPGSYSRPSSTGA